MGDGYDVVRETVGELVANASGEDLSGYGQECVGGVVLEVEGAQGVVDAGDVGEELLVEDAGLVGVLVGGCVLVGLLVDDLCGVGRSSLLLALRAQVVVEDGAGGEEGEAEEGGQQEEGPDGDPSGTVAGGGEGGPGGDPPGTGAGGGRGEQGGSAG